MTSKKVKKIKKVSTKKSVKKITKVVKPVEEIEEIDVEIDEVSTGKGKVKKPLEIDAADILPEVEEKIVDEESPLLGLEDEDSEDAVSIDSEDLNPFGDKWEM